MSYRLVTSTLSRSIWSGVDVSTIAPPQVPPHHITNSISHQLVACAKMRLVCYSITACTAL